MRILIAPDSFKESLTAVDAAGLIAAGFADVLPDAHYHCLPIADGGEGTVDVVMAATHGHKHTISATGPLGEPVRAHFGLCGDGHTAVIEMAAASGLVHIPPAQRNPLLTGSHGTGELILAALDAGARRLIIGLGGSATVDGGAGMLQVLGARLLDTNGQALPAGGGALGRLARIEIRELDARLAACTIEIAADVDNPLCGPTGAATVYGPQKGATPAMVEQLEHHLQHFAQILQRDLGRDVALLPGAGAAGGLGAALMGVLGASLRPGIALIGELVALDQAVQAADLVITGEGRLDGQTGHGKAPAGVAACARRHGKPVIAIAGSVSGDIGTHFDAAFGIVPQPCTLEQALTDAAGNLRRTARQIAATLKLAQRLPVAAPLALRATE